ncbi:hypothetical protein Apa02nite_012580 [Actinoplanes palleronii]|uniref:Uncharacterized protein n=2 Tax=Actinoplanes palleronii TaxID=113570 RepID=A0ABQ4B3B6_9ACTN|nr:hypothetical protein Apa02nite_012580 [Actinoplanes palleronii]
MNATLGMSATPCTSATLGMSATLGRVVLLTLVPRPATGAGVQPDPQT